MSLATMINGGEPMILSSGLPVTAYRNPQNWNNFDTKFAANHHIQVRKRTCGLCHKSLGKKYMRVLYCEADDLVCHERCWEQAGEIDPHQVVEKQYYVVEGEKISVKSVVVNECISQESDSCEVEEDSELSRQRQLEQYNQLWAEIVHRQRQKLLDSTPASLPSAPTPKKESKRLKELKQIKASVEAKEALHLTPVVYTAASTVDVFTEIKTQEMICDLCSKSMQTIYVRVKPRKGGDILCHEACWKVCDYNTNERLGEVARVYRYEANGKLIDKVAFSAPLTSSVIMAPTAVLPVTSTLLEVKKETRKEPIEYEPSWRQVDVREYELLKKNNEQLQLQIEKKREKKRLRAATKAAKYLDLAAVRNISPTPNIPYGKVMNLTAVAKEYVPLSAQNK